MENQKNELMEKKENALSSFSVPQQTMITLAESYSNVFNVVDENDKTELKKLALQFANKLMTTKSKTGQSAFECCTKESIQHTLFECLSEKIDLSKNQGALICYGNQLSLQKEYFGNIAQAKNLIPNLVDIRGMIIYKGDQLKIDVVNGAYIVRQHTTNFNMMNDQNIIGAYASAIYRDNATGKLYVGECEIMNINEIKTSWQQGRNGTTVHSKFGHEMTRKTVESRCAKHLINKATNYIEGDNEFLDNSVITEQDKATTLVENATTLENKGNFETFNESVINNSTPIENFENTPKNEELGTIDLGNDYNRDYENNNNAQSDFNPYAYGNNDEFDFSVFGNDNNVNANANNVNDNNNNEWFSIPYAKWLELQSTGEYEKGKYDSATKTIMVRKK